MYGIKRNIKMNPQVKKPVVKENVSSPIIVGKSQRKFKSSGYGKYKYPTYNEIPDGQYFSTVVRINDTTTQTGKPAIEVFYDIRDAGVCYKIANGWMGDNGTDGIYHIRQKYSEGNSYYDKFVYSMAQALNDYSYDFGYDETIGITEHVTYSHNGKFGSFTERMPFKFDEYKDPRLEEKDEDEKLEEELKKMIDEDTYDERYNYEDDDDYIIDD